MINEPTLEELLKSNQISQKTMDKVKIAKNYIERKYNLKTNKNIEWNNIIDKINLLNIEEDQKEKLKKEIYDKELLKERKKREKQTIYDYESIAIIGRGAFGEVHVCREKKTGNIVAIKKIKKEVISLKNQIIHTRNEQFLMSKIKSPWIVDLKASFQEGDYLYLVMEYVPGGDFMNLLIKKDVLNEQHAKFYMAEIVSAVESLHKFDCIHRDIKPDNILIDKKGHIKLSDYGLAKISDKLYDNYSKNYNINIQKINEKIDHRKNYSCVGTAFYVAPEVLKKKGYGPEIDWWSVGTIFFEMLCGYAPFFAKDTGKVIQKILHWENYLEIPQDSKLSLEAVDLIKKLINNPNCRLGKNGADEIKRHPFFNGIDWNNLLEMKPPFIPNLNNSYDVKYFDKFKYIESFHPPEPKFKKRKDAEFLGYTYKENQDDDFNIEEEYKIAIEGIDLIKNKINNENIDSKNDNNNNSNLTNKIIHMNNINNNIISKNKNNKNSNEGLESQSTGSGSNNGNDILKQIFILKPPLENNNKDKSVEKRKASSLKKIKIDCSVKIPNNVIKKDFNQTFMKRNLKNNNIIYKTYGRGIYVSPPPNKTIFLPNTERNVPTIPILKINKSLTKDKTSPVSFLRKKLNNRKYNTVQNNTDQ